MLARQTGSFKIRGATNAVLMLSEAERKHGVVTHSSGNHAQALALAGRTQGVRATIVMPSNAPEVKRKAVEGYGADVVICAPADRERQANAIAESTGATLVHPSNDPNVISGQGTIALEFLEQATELQRARHLARGGWGPDGCPFDALIVPLGGGGMLSGICAAAKGRFPHLAIFAAEPTEADDAFRSKEAGRRLGHVGGVPPTTIADGLRTTLGENTWPFVRDMVEEVCLVSEEDIAAAMRLVYERMKLVVEPR